MIEFYTIRIGKDMKILMVCLGNICRSPMAQGILEQKVLNKKLDWYVDSAGTSGWHNGEPPDVRAMKSAKSRGINISQQTSRKITPSDLEKFDVILAMDSSNYQEILKMSLNRQQKEKIHLILNFHLPGRNVSVPDPYYDGKFDEVYDLLDLALDDFIKCMTEKVTGKMISS